MTPGIREPGTLVRSAAGVAGELYTGVTDPKLGQVGRSDVLNLMPSEGGNRRVAGRRRADQFALTAIWSLGSGERSNATSA